MSERIVLSADGKLRRRDGTAITADMLSARTPVGDCIYWAKYTTGQTITANGSWQPVTNWDDDYVATFTTDESNDSSTVTFAPTTGIATIHETGLYEVYGGVDVNDGSPSTAQFKIQGGSTPGDYAEIYWHGQILPFDAGGSACYLRPCTFLRADSVLTPMVNIINGGDNFDIAYAEIMVRRVG